MYLITGFAGAYIPSTHTDIQIYNYTQTCDCAEIMTLTVISLLADNSQHQIADKKGARPYATQPEFPFKVQVCCFNISLLGFNWLTFGSELYQRGRG